MKNKPHGAVSEHFMRHHYGASGLSEKQSQTSDALPGSALQALHDVESMLGGANGPTIRIRAALTGLHPDDSDLIFWLKERLTNCQVIASQKSGSDRDGWLEDARYFRACLGLADFRPRSE